MKLHLISTKYRVRSDGDIWRDVVNFSFSPLLSIHHRPRERRRKKMNFLLFRSGEKHAILYIWGKKKSSGIPLSPFACQGEFYGIGCRKGGGGGFFLHSPSHSGWQQKNFNEFLLLSPAPFSSLPFANTYAGVFLHQGDCKKRRLEFVLVSWISLEGGGTRFSEQGKRESGHNFPLVASSLSMGKEGQNTCLWCSSDNATF